MSSPATRRSTHALGPSGRTPPNVLYGRPGIIMTPNRGFVPHMGDKFLIGVVSWRLTHPPVVFGPHRSPRGGGQPRLRAPHSAAADTQRHRSILRKRPDATFRSPSADRCCAMGL